MPRRAHCLMASMLANSPTACGRTPRAFRIRSNFFRYAQPSSVSSRCCPEISRPDRCALHQRMLRGRDEQDALRADAARAERLLADRIGDPDREIELAVLQRRGERPVDIRTQHQHHVRVPLAKTAQRRRQAVRDDALRRADAKRAGRFVAESHRAPRLLHRREDALRVREKLRAGVRDHEASRIAVEEARAELLFEVAHVRRDVRLHRIQSLRRPREVQLLGKRHEHLQLAQFHTISNRDYSDANDLLDSSPNATQTRSP